MLRRVRHGFLYDAVDRLLASHQLHWKSARELLVSGVSIERVGDLAYETGVRLHELRPVETSLEQAYLELTADSVEYTEPNK